MELWDEWNTEVRGAVDTSESDSESVPFTNKDDLYATIDAIELGDVPWQSFTVSYAGECPEGEVPSWMDKPYTIWFRCPRTILHNQISSRDFANEMDYPPQHVFTSENKHEYRNFMLGDWA